MKRRTGAFGKAAAAAIVSLALIAVLPAQTKAATLQETVTQTTRQRSLLNDVDTVSDQVSILQRSAHLAYGEISLTKLSPTRASIFGTTQAFHTCPTVELDLYVDKYDADTEEWEQWRYWEFSADNAQHLDKSLEIIVQSGYYYSVRGYHSCLHGNVIETAETVTDGLYIGITDSPVK
ncbi:MAG: DUF6147 family protein [Eubacteriales bacterium]|nr:DUF6147 family protein [Eubacteriales bacterium]